jgi:hypothetical protein
MGRLQPKHSVGSPDPSKHFLRNMAEVGVDGRVEIRIADSVEAAHTYKGKPIGLLFIDARHTVERALKRLAADGSVPAIAGRVGKAGICGPRHRWPARVQAIARKI